MRRLFASAPPADPRPAVLAVWIALLLLLLPFTLLTTSPWKLASLDLRLGGEGATVGEGPLEDVAVRLEGDDLEVVARVRRTDVLAGAGDAEVRTTRVGDLAALQDALATLHALDPQRTRIRVIPDDAATTERLVAVLDAVRRRGREPLFPDVELGIGP